MSRVTVTVEGRCGHMMDVEVNPRAPGLHGDLDIAQTLLCRDCSVRQDCEDDARMERRAAEMEKHGKDHD